MPVRKIPKNYLGVTGSFASKKNGSMDGFESPLEKEFLLLLEFDPEVESFEVQPVRVPVAGVSNGYVPDVLVNYRTLSGASSCRKPLLTDVKHTNDLAKNGKKYAPKFAAAERFAAERGWEFRPTTQTEIRTQKLANLKFLREYRNIEPSASDSKAILQFAANFSAVTPDMILMALAKTDDERLHWLPAIWHLTLTGQLTANLDEPIDMEATLTALEEC